MLLAATLLAGCDDRIDGYIPASSITHGGLLDEPGPMVGSRGREIALWGFVDHGNLYGDAGARAILQEWWAGEGPGPDTWRFNLKANAEDAVGQSFAAHVTNDSGRADLLKRFVADARAGRPTKVFVQGRLFTFDAPTQFMDLTGVYLELESSRDIRLAPPPTE